MKTFFLLLLPALWSSPSGVLSPIDTLSARLPPESRSLDYDKTGRAILFLTGATSLEELSESEVSRYESLERHPLSINEAGRSKLASSGLFSSYQLNSLLEYRATAGDIVSTEELSLVGGFSREYVRALKPFIKIVAGGPLGGVTRSKRPSQSLTLKAAVRHSGEYSYGIRYELELGERWEFGWSSRTTFSDSKFGLGSVSAAYYGKRVLGKVVLGHFNARFGQGLLSWSGFRLSSVSSVGSLYRNPSGLSTSLSAGADLFGLGVDLNLAKNFTISLAFSLKDNLPFLSAAKHFRRLSLGLSATRFGVSADWRVSLPSVSVFGEVASSYKGELAGCAGALWVPRYGYKIAMLLRYLTELYTASSDKSTLALCAELPYLTASLQTTLKKQTYNHKALLLLHRDFKGKRALLRPELKLTATFQGTAFSKAEARADLGLERGPLRTNIRVHGSWAESLGILSYLEGGWKGERFVVYLRGTAFNIKDWASRIYVYERSAPGGFSVPAFYGKGWSASAFLQWNIKERHRLYLRIEAMKKVNTKDEKERKYEARLQYMLRL